MFIAQALKKKNMCEYLLYMWQVEDLIRACHHDISEIEEKVIRPFRFDADNEKLLTNWYGDLIEMMRYENVFETGHLQISKNIVAELNDFHLLYLNEGDDAGYAAKFYYILPFITQLRKKGEAGVNDIELCLNFMYGIMLLRLKKVEISTETLKVQVEISKFLALLAENYKKNENGQLKINE